MTNLFVLNNKPPARIYLAVFLPFLSSERIRQKQPDAGFALTEKIRGAVRIAAVDARAQAQGIAPGMTLADARAQVPGLAAVAHDPDADARLLDWLVDGCDRYTPMAMADPPSGFILDITGCSHLFAQGEQGLVDDLSSRLARHGMTAQMARASTPDAAAALAKFGGDDAGALPVEALHLPRSTHTALRRAGLSRIHDLASRPRAPLAARFGKDATTLLARIMGEEDVRITPRRKPCDLVSETRFVEPVAHSNAILSAIGQLAEQAAIQMSERGQGGRRFEISLFRSDGHIARLAIDTGLPTRDPALLNRLLRERIDSLSDPLDPGFGYDVIRLGVPVLQPLATSQWQFDGSALVEGEIAALIDRLGVRLGRGQLRRLHAGDSHIPERACLSLPVCEPALPLTPWPVAEAGEPPLRPLHLFDPPEQVEVIAQVPDGPPRRFRWRRTSHDIAYYEGPERISSEWWKRRSMSGLTRDYYRVEDAHGRRFWLFRHGLYGCEKVNPDWYLHGVFA